MTSFIFGKKGLRCFCLLLKIWTWITQYNKLTTLISQSQIKIQISERKAKFVLWKHCGTMIYNISMLRYLLHKCFGVFLASEPLIFFFIIFKSKCRIDGTNILHILLMENKLSLNDEWFRFSIPVKHPVWLTDDEDRIQKPLSRD